jgi:divinyl chlorophyllide a 8-vinyl-reductase
MRVAVLGASGTIGRALVGALAAQGYEAVGVIRPGLSGRLNQLSRDCPDAQWRESLVLDAASLYKQGLRGERFDAMISCMASRTGAPYDAWRVEHHAQCQALEAARQAAIGHFVLLSAICVQRPLLAFQHAKLAFEERLRTSGLRYSIVRPTAFFKSLSGQIARVRAGKPFLVFGNGELTRCKPIGNTDLADYLIRCLHDPVLQQRVLPIGGPGPAISPREQAGILSELLGRAVPLRKLPVALLDMLVATLATGTRILPHLAEKAELAKIGRYYATESMLVFDPVSGRYDENLTPSYGSQTLRDFYAAVLSGREAVPARDEHTVFSSPDNGD